MDRRDVARLAHDVGLGDIAEELAAASEEGFRLVYAEGDPVTGVSKLGGAPDLPRGCAWPRDDTGPFAFIGQVALRDTAGRSAWRGACDGVLAFFCRRDADYCGVDPPGAARVIHIAAGVGLSRAEVPIELEEENRFGEVAVAVHPELSVPDPDSPSIADLGLYFGGPRRRETERLWALGQLVEAAQGFEDLPRHRLLGHANAVQEHPLIDIEALTESAEPPPSSFGELAERATARRLLLQIEAEYDRLGRGFGDGGTLAAGDYARVEAISHCH